MQTRRNFLWDSIFSRILNNIEIAVENTEKTQEENQWAEGRCAEQPRRGARGRVRSKRGTERQQGSSAQALEAPRKDLARRGGCTTRIAKSGRGGKGRAGQSNNVSPDSGVAGSEQPPSEQETVSTRGKRGRTRGRARCRTKESAPPPAESQATRTLRSRKAWAVWFQIKNK